MVAPFCGPIENRWAGKTLLHPTFLGHSGRYVHLLQSDHFYFLEVHFCTSVFVNVSEIFYTPVLKSLVGRGRRGLGANPKTTFETVISILT